MSLDHRGVGCCARLDAVRIDRALSKHPLVLGELLLRDHLFLHVDEQPSDLKAFLFRIADAPQPTEELAARSNDFEASQA